MASHAIARTITIPANFSKSRDNRHLMIYHLIALTKSAVHLSELNIHPYPGIAIVLKELSCCG